MKTEYRLEPNYLIGKNLQFKSTFKILWIYEIVVWRYVPNSWVANCFKEKDCPFLYLPFTTSHCFESYCYDYERVKEFVKKYSDINTLFEELKQEKKDRYSTEYIK